jgi:hypothetical protein
VIAWLVRWGLPLALTGLGLGLAFTVHEGVGEALVGAAVCVVVATQLMRYGFRSDEDRRREEAARAYFDEHGRWPDEP